jgi:hypothetical protein
MSYQLGPNEGWIGLKRSPVALGAYGSLPPDLTDRALREFIALIRSSYYYETAVIFEGLGKPVRNLLLSRLSSIDIVDRRAFARSVVARNVEASVPGVPDGPLH